ncbi:MAG: hypothetical protein V3R38_05810 [bacterium]
MKRKRLTQAVLATAIAVALSAGPAWSMGKKPKAVDKEKTLGKAGTMTKSYDPETGVKRMEKTIGHGEKTMIIEKEPHKGATILERFFGSSPKGSSTSPGQAPSAFPGKGKGKGKWK